MKKVLVIVQEGPFNTIRSSEAFRMAMGLILSSNEVSILLIGDGVWNILPLQAEQIGRPSIQTYLEYFPKVNIHLFVDAASLAEREIISPEGAEAIPHEKALSLIAGAEVVIPFR
jgi:sulfur relay (sulfurtransferase) DsrF/TusC family protein